MKRLILGIGFLLLMCSVCFAVDFKFPAQQQKEVVMSVTQDKECNCLVVKMDKFIFRIYPCGKVEKMEWKQLNPNEDNTLIFGTDNLILDNRISFGTDDTRTTADLKY